MGMSSRAPDVISPEEYLEHERQAEVKSEYVDGQAVAMAGASYVHNLITANLIGALWSRLRGGECGVMPSDMRVRAGRQYFYPDVVVVCGEPHFEDEEHDVLLNPALLIEVLSPSSRNYDRGEKFMRYQQIESLTDYLLVDQERTRVQHFHCKKGYWILAETEDLTESVALDSLGCELPLTEIYDRTPIAISE